MYRHLDLYITKELKGDMHFMLSTNPTKAGPIYNGTV